MNEHKKEIAFVTFSHSGNEVAFVDLSKNVKILNVTSAKLLYSFASTKGIDIIKFSSNDKKIISGNWDNAIRVWDIELSREILKIDLGFNRPTSIAFSPDDLYIIAGISDGRGLHQVKIWDMQGKELETYIERGMNCSYSITFSSDKTKMLISFGEHVNIWEMPSRKIIFREKIDGSDVAISPDGNKIICISNTCYQLWDIKKKSPIIKQTKYGHARKINATDFSPDGSKIASISNYMLKVWNVKTGKLAWEKWNPCELTVKLGNASKPQFYKEMEEIYLDQV